MLAGSDSNAVRLQGLPDLSVSRNVVGGSGLLDEPGRKTSDERNRADGRSSESDGPGVERLELDHVVDGLSDVPDLVGVDHEDAAWRGEAGMEGKWSA